VWSELEGVKLGWIGAPAALCHVGGWVCNAQDTVSHRVRFHNETDGGEREEGVQYWPTPTAGAHVLSVVLDYGQTDVQAGNVTVRYCGWPSFPCQCGVGACVPPSLCFTDELSCAVTS